MRGLPLAHFLGSNEIECARKIRCTEKVDCTAEVPEVDPCERLPSPAEDGANPHACRACHGEKCTSVRCEYDTETGNDCANASRCSMGLGLPIAAETSQEVFAGLFRTFVVAACGGIEANGRCGYKGIDALASIHSFYQPPDNSGPAFVKQVFVFVAPSVVDGCACDVDNRVAGCECFDEFFSSSCRQEFAADGDNCVPFPAQMGGQMGPDETRGAAEGDRFFLFSMVVRIAGAPPCVGRRSPEAKSDACIVPNCRLQGLAYDTIHSEGIFRYRHHFAVV